MVYDFFVLKHTPFDSDALLKHMSKYTYSFCRELWGHTFILPLTLLISESSDPGIVI